MEQKRYVCLNGRLVREAKALLPVSDRGFRFGDGVFETIRIEEGVPYQWESHMVRFAGGLNALRIKAPVDDFKPYARKLIARNRGERGFLRIHVSRGMGSRGYLPFPPDMPAHWVIEYLPPLEPPSAPCRLWLSGLVKPSPAMLPTQYKLAQGLNSTLALLEAVDHACDEALQLTADGMLASAASANLFWVEGGQLYTPALSTGCLAGTTREALLRLSKVKVKTVKRGLSVLEKAEAVFISNCRLGIWPVAEILPMGWRYAPDHPLLARLEKSLRRDQQVFTRRHKREWNRR